MEALQHHSSSTDHNNNNNNNNHNNNHAPSNDKATAATTTSPAITSSSATPNSVSKSNDSGITSSNNNSSGGSKREFRYDGEVRPDSVLMRALRLIDWAFWGNFWFMLGSLAYLIAGAPIPRLCWWWGTQRETFCSWLLLLAAVDFIIDSLCYMLDWYLNVHRPIDRTMFPLAVVECTWLTPFERRMLFWARRLDVRIMADLMFLVGSLFYLSEAIVWLWFQDEEELYFWLDLFGSHAFVLDACLYMIDNMRWRYSTAPEDRYLWFSGWSSWRDWVYADWEFMGDILFLLGSVCYSFNSWWGRTVYYDSYYSGAIINLFAAANFVVDSALYFFAWHIRRRGWDLGDSTPITGSTSYSNLGGSKGSDP